MNNAAQKLEQYVNEAAKPRIAPGASINQAMEALARANDNVAAPIIVDSVVVAAQLSETYAAEAPDASDKQGMSSRVLKFADRLGFHGAALAALSDVFGGNMSKLAEMIALRAANTNKISLVATQAAVDVASPAGPHRGEFKRSLADNDAYAPKLQNDAE